MHSQTKVIYATLKFLLPAIALIACEDEVISERKISNTEIFVATVMAGQEKTRTTNTDLQTLALNHGTVAGIYTYLSGYTEITDGYGYENKNYSYANGVWKHSSINFPVDEDKSLDIYVYAPRIDSEHTLNNIPVTVALDQSTETNYLASDFVFGSEKNVTNPRTNSSKEVNVTLYHAMSKIVLNIQDKDGVTSTLGHLSKVEIGSERFPVMTDAYVNITRTINSNDALQTTSAVLTGGTPGIITLMDVSSVDLGFSMAGILPPQTLGSGGNNMTVYFTNDGQVSTFEGVLTGTFRPGYVNTYTVVIDQSELTILNASIIPWGTTESVSKVISN